MCGGGEAEEERREGEGERERESTRGAVEEGVSNVIIKVGN